MYTEMARLNRFSTLFEFSTLSINPKLSKMCLFGFQNMASFHNSTSGCNLLIIIIIIIVVTIIINIITTIIVIIGLNLSIICQRHTP